MDARNARVVSFAGALELIQQERGVVKVVSVDPFSDRCVEYVLDQMVDPVHKRPVLALDDKQYARHYVWNPLTGMSIYREVEYVLRGRPKQGAQFTKKTSVSLLPSDGMSKLFKPKHGHPVGLLFDLNGCHLKQEKYIFPSSVMTDSRFWIKNKLNLPKVNSIGLQGLRENLRWDRQHNIIPEENELLVGLCKEALRGLVVTENNVESRLKALYLQKMILKRFQLSLPIMIIELGVGVREYAVQDQHQDLISYIKEGRIFLPVDFLQKIREHLSGEVNDSIDSAAYGLEVDHHDVKFNLSYKIMMLKEVLLMPLAASIPEITSPTLKTRISWCEEVDDDGRDCGDRVYCAMPVISLAACL